MMGSCSATNDVACFNDYESNDAVSKDEMLSNACIGSPAAQHPLDMDLDLASILSNCGSYEWPTYPGAAEAVGSVGAAELQTPPILPMRFPDEQQYDRNALAHSTNSNSMSAGSSSGYTGSATQGGQKQETMQRALATTNDDKQTNIYRWPEMQRGRPDRNKREDQFGFSIDATSNLYYSKKLSTLFVDTDKNFTIRFNWNGALLSEGAGEMYVRAIVMYGDEAHKQNPVTICNCTKHCDFKEGVTPEGRRAECYNVLRSASAIGSQGVHYCGAPGTPDMWYSVLTPLSETHAYYMKCWGSCESDKQRRVKQILFVLETSEGAFFGRDSLRVQVCAAPARDMCHAEIQENSTRGRRRIPASGRGKRRTPASASAPFPVSAPFPASVTASTSTSAPFPASASAPAPASATGDYKRACTLATPLTLPPIPVPNRKILLQTLLHMKTETEYSMSKSLTPEDLETHKNTIEELKKNINELERQMND